MGEGRLELGYSQPGAVQVPAFFAAVLFLVLNLAAVFTMADVKVPAYIHLRFDPTG